MLVASWLPCVSESFNRGETHGEDGYGVRDFFVRCGTYPDGEHDANYYGDGKDEIVLAHGTGDGDGYGDGWGSNGDGGGAGCDGANENYY